MYVYDSGETFACWLPKASQHQSGQLVAAFGISYRIEMEDHHLSGIPRTIFAWQWLAERTSGISA